MHVTSKGQVTIPKEVRDSLGIIPAKTEVKFCQDQQGRWYITKEKTKSKNQPISYCLQNIKYFHEHNRTLGIN